VQKKPNNDHDYDSLSLEFAYAGNMWKNMPHICAAYFAKFRIFCLQKFAYFKKIIRYKPTSLVYMIVCYVYTWCRTDCSAYTYVCIYMMFLCILHLQ